MQKLGLIFELFGFLLLFYQTYVRPSRSIKNGGGCATTTADEEHQLQKALMKIIPSENITSCLAKYWQKIALALIILGVILQII